MIYNQSNITLLKLQYYEIKMNQLFLFSVNEGISLIVSFIFLNIIFWLWAIHYYIQCTYNIIVLGVYLFPKRNNQYDFKYLKKIISFTVKLCKNNKIQIYGQCF